MTALPEDCFSVEEAMAELEKSRNTIYKYIKQKKLVAYRVGSLPALHIGKASVQKLKSDLAAVVSNVDQGQSNS